MTYREYLKSERPILDKNNKFMFFSINKVMQTSINRVLLKDRVLVYKDEPELWSRKYDGYSDSDIRNIYKFTIVRNPWDKAVSFFFYFKQINHPKVSGCRTFDDFVCNCLSVEGVEFDGHLEHQYPKAFFQGEQYVNDIWRLENISSDWKRIAGKIGSSDGLPHANRSHHKHYSEYYTPRSMEIVANVYAKDIELFGYDFGPEKTRFWNLPFLKKIIG